MLVALSRTFASQASSGKTRHFGTSLVGLSFFSQWTSGGKPTGGGGGGEDEDSLEVEKFQMINTSDAFMAEPVTERRLLMDEKHLMRRRMELFIMSVQKKVFQTLLDIEREQHELKQKSDSTTNDWNANDIVSIDRWLREEGGGGITCIIQGGQVFEKAGVNISVVYGILPPAAVQQMRSRGKQFNELVKDSTRVPFFAAGVSSVIHPSNPNVPTIHFNYRYFEVDQPTAQNEAGDKMWWFGGGTDLTPYLLDEQDCKLFHQELKAACDKHDKTYYGRFKKWCDDYFYIVHRKERRGVGGLFFDDIDYPDQDKAFAFVRSCAQHILPSYIPLVLKNINKPWSEQDREWQLLRRGRYTEFNLVYDRGTKFGLVTPGARYESILMSLPLYAKWLYCHEPEPGSNYAKLMEVLKEPRDWV